MELKQKLNNLHERVDNLKAQITTEEATKNAFVMPFLQILGYDIFNPIEVVPEFTADLGTKKGEKVDYAIMKDGQPIIIIECKHWKEKLDSHASQLHRYFNVTKSRFAILTNGVKYEFYTDLEKSNIMDSKPFLEINLDKLKDNNVKQLIKFQKENYNQNDILNSASSLKYIKALRVEFEKELESPSDELTKILVKRFFDGKLNSNRLENFKEYLASAIKSSINDTINNRLHKALSTQAEKEEEISIEDSKINTTEEELEGFQIVKAILRQKISSNQIAHRDTQSYFGILFEDNNRKPICRLYVEGERKRIGLFDEDKKEIKHDIDSIEDIYKFSELLLATTEMYTK
ncbi:MAG: type I restriction enzyme HsdR N-terminal domain-containing protein [Flavobacteriales bacterium]|jgi:hypothetical protein|nr:type I restriction enzyme HsdR N-terminal domain-containing protein [Flavobacteriales bacterium]